MIWLLSCGGGASLPDVVIISVDTLRADRFGFMGHDGAHTPHLDALAAASVVFTQATTPLPRTTPALSSLQTGLLPAHHGSREVGQPMTATRTLAQAFRDGGYTTLGLSAIEVASAEQGLDRGFQTFELDHDGSAGALIDRALALVNDAGRAPLYLWVHLSDPHFPYLPAADGPVQPVASRCREVGKQAAAGKLRHVRLFSNRGGLALAIREECQALYDAEIAVVDQAIGKLIAGLDEHRRARPRWLVVTADHGENQGEGGLFFEHGPDVHDASLRVPLIVSGPGLVGRRDDGVARLHDVAPTLLAEVGLPGPPQMDGVSLGPRLRGEPGGPTILLAESGSALHATLFQYLVSGSDDRWCINEGNRSWCKRGPRSEPGLFDNHTDANLKKDLQADEPELADRLRTAATRWPPEQARERTARTATHKLVSRPQLAGGYASTLYAVDAGGSERVVVDAAVQETLEAALETFVSQLGDALPVPQRSEEDITALRALGYVE